MRLIADSGSTKTDWRLISSNNEITQYSTDGINPYYQSSSDIIEIINQLNLDIHPDEVFFYGAGCSSDSNVYKIKEAIGQRFKKSDIKVNSDILAACRSLAGENAGIVCILGTGSNACYYDGNTILESTPSLGYVLGDYGSGNWLGRRLLIDYFGKRMDAETLKLFESEFKDEISIVIKNTYQEKRPATYLATYAKFIGENMNRPYFYSLVYDSFHQFFENDINFLKEHRQLPIHFTGSIAFNFSNILRKVGSDMNLHVKNIIQSPIAGLTLFHQYSLKKI